MRSVLALLLVAMIASPAAAADQNAIDAAVKKGATFLASRYKNLKAPDAMDVPALAALAGLALLETGRNADDPTVKAIAALVRHASYSEIQTYHLALYLLFLDRLGRKSDEPLIQLLAVRLLAGQNGNGGWTYDCIEAVGPAEEQRLRTKLDTNQLVSDGKGPDTPKEEPKVDPGKALIAGRLHAEVERHQRGLLANERNRVRLPDDNSNTQFAILAVWVARKHGVNVENALDLLEKRFLASQLPSGGWPYSGLLAASEGSPSMTCAGLLGLSIAVGRREERRLQAVVPKRPDPKPEPKTPDDPFFTPVPKPEPKKVEPKKPVGDMRDRAIDRALENLAGVLRGEKVARGRNPVREGRLNDRDYYFLWSLERVGVVYGLQKIGNVDWYDLGAERLLPNQDRDGSWPGGHSLEVDTSFALLFLAKSNLVRDLTAKVQRDPSNSELRGGPAPGGFDPPDAKPSPEPRPMPKSDPGAVIPVPMANVPVPATPKPQAIPPSDEAAKLAEALLKVPATVWTKALEHVRDGKGADFTQALALVVRQVDGDRKKAARDALAERLTRMSAETLRGMLKCDDAELRRAAALACAMKDDKTHVPDLIERLASDEDLVVRAARAGLKSLAGGKDFGPEPGYTKLDREVAVEEWTAWWAKQRK